MFCYHNRNQSAKLAALLSVELGTVRTLVAANVSRDRGFRAIGECLGTLVVLFSIAPALAPELCFSVVSLAAVTATFNRKNGKLFAMDAMAQVSPVPHTYSKSIPNYHPINV